MARNVGWPLELKVAPDSSQEGIYMLDFITFWGLHDSSVGKESACNAGEPGLIPGSGRSTGEGIGYPLQYSCLGNPLGQRNLGGYTPWGHTESGTTEVT